MFHETSISLYQINKSNLPHKKFNYENKIRFKSTMPELPENYTNIMQGKCRNPELPSNKHFFPSESETRYEATAWLDALRESI